ncbi:MAG TPA: tetratricopeptide repeat protein, partial [Burkholderiaceae bacterium]|nr:tetratricopeptide repeat protein [Burkholderiaceae bacterium]
TAYENYVIDRMRGSAAANNGDDELAATSFESVVASGRLPAAEQLRVIQAIAGTYFKIKNYSKAASWSARYLKDGGTDLSVQDLLINSHYLSNDFTAAASELKTLIDADEKAGRATSEVHLQLLLTCYQKLGNNAGSSAALEKLLNSYPKKEYWQLAISHLVHRSGFAERLELDLLRLQLALGDLKREADFMTMGQLALEAGFPAEAKKVVDQGFAAGILGKGAEAERHKRLQNKVIKDAAEDLKNLGQGDADAEKAKGGDALLNTGYNYVLNGKFEHGLSMMEKGLRKGALKHPEDAKLHLGIAYYLAGDKSKAVQMLRSVQGTDGTADLAHLWAVYVGAARA